MRKLYVALALLTVVFLFSSSAADEQQGCSGDGSRKSAGPPSCYAGEPPNFVTCGTAGCHDSSPVNSGSAQLSLNLGGADATYTPGQQYTVTVSLSRTGLMRGGFQVVALQDNNTAVTPGIVTLTETTRTQRIDAAHPHPGPCATQDKVWVQHTDAGIDDVANNTIQWQFNWQAPASDVGSITFYLAAIDANMDLDNTGDHVYKLTKTIQAPGTGITSADGGFSLAVFPNPAKDVLQLMWPENYSPKQGDGITLVNMKGQTVLSAPLKQLVQLGAIEPGLYLLLVNCDGKQLARRFIKN